jgi:hypothetical protein
MEKSMPPSTIIGECAAEILKAKDKTVILIE